MYRVQRLVPRLIAILDDIENYSVLKARSKRMAQQLNCEIRTVYGLII